MGKALYFLKLLWQFITCGVFFYWFLNEALKCLTSTLICEGKIYIKQLNSAHDSSPWKWGHNLNRNFRSLSFFHSLNMTLWNIEVFRANKKIWIYIFDTLLLKTVHVQVEASMKSDITDCSEENHYLWKEKSLIWEVEKERRIYLLLQSTVRLHVYYSKNILTWPNLGSDGYLLWTSTINRKQIAKDVHPLLLPRRTSNSNATNKCL